MISLYTFSECARPPVSPLAPLKKHVNCALVEMPALETILAPLCSAAVSLAAKGLFGFCGVSLGLSRSARVDNLIKLFIFVDCDV